MHATVPDLSHLNCMKQMIYEQSKFMFSSTYRASNAHPHGFTGFKSSADHSQHNLLPFYFQTSSYFTSTENSGSLVQFCYCLLWFTLSFITFPNIRGWEDFCFVHFWKHNANSLQGLQDLTRILSDSLLYLSVSSNITQNCLFTKKGVTITSCHTV